jgi:DNA-binding winged helix-turn-helix (wHTH) protein/Tol biopolymer transport system component
MDNGNASRLEFGNVTLIPDERRVLMDGRPLAFTPKAFDLLVVLAENAGHLLTKEQLMQAVWPDTTVEEANLAYHVFAIRKALGESAESGQFIETVPKRGYRFVAPVRRVDGALKVPPPAAATAEPARDAANRRRPRAATAGWLGLAAAFALGALVFLGRGGLRAPPGAVPLRFQEPVMGRLAATGMFSVSPDGQRLVYATEGPDGIMRLWMRTLSALQPAPLPGTDVFTIVPPAIWSPDSRFVAYDPGLILKKVGVDGGAPQTVCAPPHTAVGGSWNRQGDLLLGNPGGGVAHCAASGGPPTTVTTSGRSGGEGHLFPSFLSDGRRFIYLRLVRSNPEASGIYAAALGTTSPDPGRRLITTGFGATFVAATDGGPGLIVFARDGVLFAQRFDEQRLEMIGEPMRLADGIGSYLDGAFFSASSKTLVYRAQEPQARLTWFDRQGKQLGRVDTPGRFFGLALSPDGGRALVSTLASQGTANEDLWLYDLTRSALPRRVTFGPELERAPLWASNDRFLYGTGGGISGVFAQTVTGTRATLFESRGPEMPSSISADGRILLYTTITSSVTGGDVWVRTGEGASATTRPFLAGKLHQWQAQLSPDLRWVAYVSTEAGPNEVFLSELRLDSTTGAPSHGESVRISEGGGTAPRWRGDGRELLYLTPDGSVMSIEIDATGQFRPSAAKRLFRVTSAIPEWGLTQDGTRFLFAVPVSPSPPFDVVQDWQAALPK